MDEKKIEEKNRARAALDELIETGDEEGFVALVKASRNVSPRELIALIEGFREQRRQLKGR